MWGKIMSAELDYSFLTDGMLGSLARKLRILGFDTLYDSSSGDNELVRKAKENKRILVTSDVNLQIRAKRWGASCVLIQSLGEEGRLIELFSKIGISKKELGSKSRCTKCNGCLTKTRNKTGMRKSIYKCIDCGKLYWRGAHWKRLASLFENVAAKLD